MNRSSATSGTHKTRLLEQNSNPISAQRMTRTRSAIRERCFRRSKMEAELPAFTHRRSSYFIDIRGLLGSENHNGLKCQSKANKKFCVDFAKPDTESKPEIMDKINGRIASYLAWYRHMSEFCQVVTNRTKHLGHTRKIFVDRSGLMEQ